MKGRGERLWLIVSHVWFRSCSDFGWFYCIFPVEEQRGTKRITQGELTQEMRQWWERAGDETDSGTEQSLNESRRASTWRGFTYIRVFLCLRWLFRCVDLQVYESHTGKWEGPHAGLSPCQGRGYFHIYLSRRFNNGLPRVLLAFTLREMRICGVETLVLKSVWLRMRRLCVIAYSPDGAVMFTENKDLSAFPFHFADVCL